MIFNSDKYQRNISNIGHKLLGFLIVCSGLDITGDSRLWGLNGIKWKNFFKRNVTLTLILLKEFSLTAFKNFYLLTGKSSFLTT
jgi:hypothetical protein